MSQNQVSVAFAIGLMLTLQAMDASAEEKQVVMFARHAEEIARHMPLSVTIVVRNSTDQLAWLSDVETQRKQMHVRMESMDGAVVYEGFARRSLRAGDVLPGVLELKPGVQVAFDVFLACAFVGGNQPGWPLFDVPGTYRLSFRQPGEFFMKTGEAWKRSGVELQTSPTLIRVMDAEARHMEAFAVVRQMSQPLLILEPGYCVLSANGQQGLLDRWDGELEAFLANHGESPWAPLAWLARAHIHDALARNDGGPVNLAGLRHVVQLAQQASERAQTHRIPSARLQAMALWAAALDDLGDPRQADQIRERMKGEVGPEPRPVPQAPGEKPEGQSDAAKADSELPAGLAAQARHGRVIEQLQAQGYDLAELRRHMPFVELENQAHAAFAEGSISMAVYFNRLSDALEQMAPKHLTPLPLEELRQRREQRKRAFEEMFQQAEQEEREERERLAREIETNPGRAIEEAMRLWEMFLANRRRVNASAVQSGLDEQQRAQWIEVAEAGWLGVLPSLHPLVREQFMRLLEEDRRKQKDQP